MARSANETTNSPSADDIKSAVTAIEGCYEDLLSERGSYMNACKQIRERMSDVYGHAADKGVAKKLLRKIVRERELERKIFALTDGLEDDEKSEIDMLKDKLGEFANTPLGAAAVTRANGGDLAHAGS